MERHVHEELGVVRQRFSAMGALVESRVREAVAALAERDADLAVRVATGDAAVNSMELEVDDLCLRALALYNPVASDLRLIRSVIKANTDLERIGDQAVNIAEAAIDLIEQPALEAQSDVSALAGIALDMLHDSLVAFVAQDSAQARLVLRRDDQADAMRDGLIHKLIVQMRADPETVQPAQGLIRVSRGLERVADHATNLAEVLIFVVEGRDVRHDRDYVA